MSRASSGNNHSWDEHQEPEDVSSAEIENTTDDTESEDNNNPHEIDDGRGSPSLPGIPSKGDSLSVCTLTWQGPLLEMLFKLCVLFITQTFTDGQPQSSVLVYFSGVLGISSNGGHFLAARLFTHHLSALIYIQRLLFLEYALPLREYSYLGWPCRPRSDHLTRLDKIRRQYMLPGSMTPLGEFQNLRLFGKRQALLDPPSVFVHWSPNGDTVFLENITITMEAFRALPGYFIRQAEELCSALLLNIRPHIDFNGTQDSLVDNRPDQSIIRNPANQLKDRYLLLAEQAASRPDLGLMQGGSGSQILYISILSNTSNFWSISRGS
ncbi:hypothetical protein N7526_003414 [Penicillium atrosanguineum]|nr:hypothetical protein N7526_003414 [Penicillium atrosanguineum]